MEICIFLLLWRTLYPCKCPCNSYRLDEGISLRRRTLKLGSCWIFCGISSTGHCLSQIWNLFCCRTADCLQALMSQDTNFTYRGLIVGAFCQIFLLKVVKVSSKTFNVPSRHGFSAFYFDQLQPFILPIWFLLNSQR